MVRELFTKVYTRINWKNRSESMTTALGATLLNRMDYAIDETDSRIASLDILKAEESEVLQMVKEWSIDEETGIITVTKKNGEKIMFDLNIEKIPVSFTLSQAGILTMTTDDGTKFTADIGSMIPVLTFKASDTISVTVEGTGINKTYSFSVKEGSIKDKHLQPSYLADIKVQAQAADKSAGAAQTEADRAKTEADRAKTEADRAKTAADTAGALGAVTGVKGAAETTYRTGLVNMTAVNIGALPDGTVPVSKGGTGQTTAANAANFLINSLPASNTNTPADNDYFISQYINGGTTNTTYHRRPLSKLWEYIKGKINTATDIVVANAIKATKDGQGNVITDTYTKSSTSEVVISDAGAANYNICDINVKDTGMTLICVQLNNSYGLRVSTGCWIVYYGYSSSGTSSKIYQMINYNYLTVAKLAVLTSSVNNIVSVVVKTTSDYATTVTAVCKITNLI